MLQAVCIPSLHMPLKTSSAMTGMLQALSRLCSLSQTPEAPALRCLLREDALKERVDEIHPSSSMHGDLEDQSSYLGVLSRCVKHLLVT